MWQALDLHIASRPPEAPLAVEKCKGHAMADHIASGEATEETRHGNNQADRCADKGCSRLADGTAYRDHQQFRQAWQKRLLRSCAAVLEARAQQIARTRSAAAEATPPAPRLLRPVEETFACGPALGHPPCGGSGAASSGVLGWATLIGCLA